LDAIKMILGTYGMTSDFTTFLAQDFSNSNGPRPDIARLAGARFVVSIEVDEGKQLAEGLVKSLTGGEKITTRFLFGREFEFLPAFKLWLSANVTPKARPDDDAIWNRIVRIPFTHVVPLEKRDPRIKLALRNAQKAGPAILAWAVKGCLEWQKSGLMIPAEVKSSSEGYRLEVDGLAGFIEDCCILEPGAWSWSSVLVDEYERWSRANNEKKTLRGRAFGERLKVRGCTAERREKGNLGASRGWSGIRLIDENA
jgi:putative DNA primase/helicase